MCIQYLPASFREKLIVKYFVWNVTNISWRKKIKVVRYIDTTKFSTATMILCDIHPTRWRVKCHRLVIHQTTHAVYTKTIWYNELEFTLIFWADNRNQYVSRLTTHKWVTVSWLVVSLFILCCVGLHKIQMEVEMCWSWTAAVYGERWPGLPKTSKQCYQAVININKSVVYKAVSCTMFPS